MHGEISRQGSPEPSGRPFYKKKRYVLPALLLAAGLAAPDSQNQPVAATSAQTFAAPAQQQTTQALDGTGSAADQAAAGKAAADRLALQKVAEKAAVDRAAAEAAVRKAEAERAAAKAALKKANAAKAAARKATVQRAAAQKAAARKAAAARRAAAAETAAGKVSSDAPSGVYYKNCTAVRAAGKAPIRVGQPGYARHLDRDGDGQGCGADQ